MQATSLHAAPMPAFPVPSVNDLNPLTYLGDVITGSVADAWTTSMLSLWQAGLWLTRWIFGVVGALSTPDVSENGPLRSILATTLWISATLAVILALVQLIVALVRRDGQSFGRLLLGLLQYGFVWVAFLGCAAGAVAAAAGLEHGILRATLGIDVLSSYDVTAGWARKGVDASAATVLGITSLLLLIPAAFFALLIGLVRAASLIVLVAVAPITAAGLLSEATKGIFWKSLRWFISAVLIAPNTALVMGLGEKVSAGVVEGQGDKTAAAIGTSLVGAVMVMVAVVSPLALYRLLAWVDPGTPSGAALRQSWADAGGLAGVAGGRVRGGRQAGGGGAAGQVHADGRSGGESAAENTTQSRIAAAMGAMGSGVHAVTAIAMRSGDLAADVLGGAGVGSPGYSMTPADERAMRSGKGEPAAERDGAGGGGGDAGGGSHSSGSAGGDGDGGAPAPGGAGQPGSPGAPGAPGSAGPSGSAGVPGTAGPPGEAAQPVAVPAVGAGASSAAGSAAAGAAVV